VQTRAISTYVLLIVSVCRISDCFIVSPVAPPVLEQAFITVHLRVFKAFVFRTVTPQFCCLVCAVTEVSISLVYLNLACTYSPQRRCLVLQLYRHRSRTHLLINILFTPYHYPNRVHNLFSLVPSTTSVLAILVRQREGTKRMHTLDASAYNLVVFHHVTVNSDLDDFYPNRY